MADGVVRDVKLQRGAHDRPELAAVSIGQTLGMTRWPM